MTYCTVKMDSEETPSKDEWTMLSQHAVASRGNLYLSSSLSFLLLMLQSDNKYREHWNTVFSTCFPDLKLERVA